MESVLIPESSSLPITREYRIREGKVESRILDGDSAHMAHWTEVSSQQLSHHVLGNTAVARWAERNLGWRRLLQACVGQEPDEQEPNEMECGRQDRSSVYQ